MQDINLQDICKIPPQPRRNNPPETVSREKYLDVQGEWNIQDKRSGANLIVMCNHYLNGPLTADMHTHHSLEISCVPAGTGTYHIGEQFFDILPGDVFILNNSEPHGLILKQGEFLLNRVIQFDPSFIWNSLGNDLDYKFLLIFFERGPGFSNRLDRSNPATKRIFDLIGEILCVILAQRPHYELLVKIKLQMIFTEIIRNYDYIDAQNAGKPLHESDVRQMNAVMRHIDKHLDGDLRLRDLAAIAHVSPSYFSTLFKQFNGVPPVEYIINKRIQRAIEYIRTTDMNLTDIAMACGFNNSANFYKSFRKVTGQSPAYYRAQKEAEKKKQAEQSKNS